MTRIEAVKAVLDDATRSESDRAKAISILKRIADDVADLDCAEAKRLIAVLPPSQDEEDALLEEALRKDVEQSAKTAAERLAEYRADRRRPRQSPHVERLRELLFMDAIFLTDTWHRQPDYTLQFFADLKALHDRTNSAHIRAGVVERLRKLAWQGDDACRAAARKALADIGAETK